ncbi:hypothetical protein BTH42_29120 [Burkholderia sp. SRS-W-2-2016]|nr:hypothetical protein BTH42_29120 [Burkholderia sp. SRS-W-2-2016]
MFDGLVADGDGTTTGGVVMGRSEFYNEDGRCFARKENLATCGNCKGGWPIYGTASDWMDDDVPLVKNRDRVLCPCGKNFVLAAISSNAFYSTGENTRVPAPVPIDPVYSQQYLIQDKNGQPLANTRYRAFIGSTEVAKGVTDSQGRTERISAESAKRITLQVGDI